MATALERLGLTEDQARRLLGALRGVLDSLEVRPSNVVVCPVVLSEAEDDDPWTEEDREEALRKALRWLKKYRPEVPTEPLEPEEAEQAEAQHLREQEDDPRWSHLERLEQFTAKERLKLFGDVERDYAAAMNRAAERLIAGKTSPNEFRRDMERAIWIDARAAFLAGKMAMGGEAQLSREEERELRRWGNFQVNRLIKFVDAIKKGEQSDAQIRNRTEMYTRAIERVYENGQARAFGDLYDELPQKPRDGQTACGLGCKCYLELVPEYKGGKLIAVNVYWRLRPAEHCKDCLRLAAMKPFYRWVP